MYLLLLQPPMCCPGGERAFVFLQLSSPRWESALTAVNHLLCNHPCVPLSCPESSPYSVLLLFHCSRSSTLLPSTCIIINQFITKFIYK